MGGMNDNEKLFSFCVNEFNDEKVKKRKEEDEMMFILGGNELIVSLSTLE